MPAVDRNGVHVEHGLAIHEGFPYHAAISPKRGLLKHSEVSILIFEQ